MIYVLNETKKKLSLKADTLGNKTVLSVLADGGVELPIVSTTDEAVSKAMIDRFKDSEVIKNQSSRHNFRIEGARTFIDRYKDAEPDYEVTGFEGTAKLITIGVNDDLPERYAVAKDMIVVVHNADDVVEMSEDDLNGKVIPVNTENSDIAVTIFIVKWYNWSKLRSPANIYINEEAVYTLSAIPSQHIEGRMINSVKCLRKKQNKKSAK